MSVLRIYEQDGATVGRLNFAARRSTFTLRRESRDLRYQVTCHLSLVTVPTKGGTLL